MRRILIFILFLFYSKAALTQIELIKNLLLDTTTNSTFHIHTIKGISVEKITKEYSDKVLHEKYRYFIKRGKDLFAFIDGTGRLYKVSLLNNEIEFTRLDSTIHFGYNIASFAFCNQNKIYNIGGYGIWRTNGQLRVYNFKDKEWDIVKLNKEIPFMGDANLLYYNPTQNKIYIGFYNALNEAIKADEFAKEYVFDVMELDLKNNDWTKLGTLNTSLQNNLSQLRAISISPWGLLAELMGKFILLDYENNQILSAENSNKQSIINFYRKKDKCDYYFKDSTLFYSEFNSNEIDSVKLSINDFKPTGQTIYSIKKESVFIKTKNWLALFTILVLAFLLWFGIKQKKKKKIINAHELTTLNLNKNKEQAHKLFSEKEIQVLKLFIENTKNNKKTNIEELNTVLGVSKKSVEIQKKYRSDVILSINDKYSIHSKSANSLIKREKNEYDGRIFEYYISNEFINNLTTLI